MGAWLRSRLPEEAGADGMLAEGRFVYDDGSRVLDHDPYRPHTFVWFHRELRDEPEVPGEIRIVHRDERILVVDKPPFLSTIPRGRHVRQSVVVRLRDALDLPELTPAHRLDRITSGLLVLVVRKRWRGAYQMLFQEQKVRKVYRALAPRGPRLELPTTVHNHIRKRRGIWQAEIVPDAPPNARSLIELESVARDSGVYRLTPATGRTHQLRVHMNGLGIPIVNDPLYPAYRDVDVDDFTSPLQLLASELSFIDPVSGELHHFVSERRLPLMSATAA